MEICPAMQSCRFQCRKKSNYFYFFLKKILPPRYNYIFCDIDLKNMVPTLEDRECFRKSSFQTHFYVSLKDETQAQVWLSKFSRITKIFFKENEEGASSAEELQFECCCLLQKESSVNCKTSVKMKIQSFDHRQNSDNEEEEHHCLALVSLFYDHQHEGTVIWEMFRYSFTVDEDLLAQFDEEDRIFEANLYSELNKLLKKNVANWFEKGYTPSEAYCLYKTELRSAFPQDFKRITSNKRICPGVRWVCQQYNTYLEKKHGILIGTAIAVPHEPHKKARAGKHVELAITQVQKIVEKLTQIAHDNNPTLDRKVNELCKKYVPILPATENTIASPLFHEEAILNAADFLPLSILPAMPSPSFDESVLQIVNLNAEDVLIPSSTTSIIVVPSFSHNETKSVREVMVAADQKTENDKMMMVQNTTTSDTETVQNTTTAVPTVAAVKPHRRKPILKYEEPDEILFTDSLEELKEKTQPSDAAEMERKKKLNNSLKRYTPASPPIRINKKIKPNISYQNFNQTFPFSAYKIENIVCAE